MGVGITADVVLAVARRPEGYAVFSIDVEKEWYQESAQLYCSACLCPSGSSMHRTSVN